MGSFTSVHLVDKQEKSCATCGMENNGCCHDDVKVLKIDNAQFLANNLIPASFLNQHFFFFPPTIHPFNLVIPEVTFIPSFQKYYEGLPIRFLNGNFRV